MYIKFSKNIDTFLFNVIKIIYIYIFTVIIRVKQILLKFLTTKFICKKSLRARWLKKELILTTFYLLCLLCGKSKVFASDRESSDRQHVKQVKQPLHHSKHKSHQPSGKEIQKKVEKIEEAKKLLEDLRSQQVSTHETKEGLNASFQTVKQAQTVLGILESELKEMLGKYFSSVSSSERDEDLSSHTISKQKGKTDPHKIKKKILQRQELSLRSVLQDIRK